MVSRIQGTTMLMGTIGYPIKHSKSPKMHNTAFEALGLDYVYLALEVKEGFTEEAVNAMRVFNVKGFNVTMPHKVRILDYLDEITEEAKIIGAVNTVKNVDGRLIGYNTDGKGFVQDLKEHKQDFIGKKIVIIGAGGVAKSISIQLAYDGAGEIVVFNRTLQKAKELVDIINSNIPACKGRTIGISDKVLKDELKDAAILINCTSVGMDPNINKSVIENSKILHKDLFIADVVYNPIRTKLLSIAEEAGCKTMNGIGMLLWQGAIAFKIWTGQDMPVDLIRKEVFGS